jgi:hypothetical protein
MLVYFFNVFYSKNKERNSQSMIDWRRGILSRRGFVIFYLLCITKALFFRV